MPVSTRRSSQNAVQQEQEQEQEQEPAGRAGEAATEGEGEGVKWVVESITDLSWKEREAREKDGYWLDLPSDAGAPSCSCVCGKCEDSPECGSSDEEEDLNDTQDTSIVPEDEPRNDNNEEEEEDACSSSEDDEEEDEDDRSEAEMEAIHYEILELEAELGIEKKYKIVDRLGEGTFSAVYKAIDCQHPFYNNERWRASSPCSSSILPPSFSENPHRNGTSTSNLLSNAPRESQAGRARPHARSSSIATTSTSVSSSRESYQVLLHARKELKRQSTVASLDRHQGGSPVYVALKRIYVTSSPARIHNELDILADLRDARNTCYLIDALRHEDQVVAVMPYSRHQDFRHYYRELPLSSMRAYFTCLFSALADCHKQGIMHRDVKPANFLFDMHTNTGSLCDFGLAQRFNTLEWHGRCLHSMPELWKAHQSHGPIAAALNGKKLASPVDPLTQYERSWQDWLDTSPDPDLLARNPYAMFDRDLPTRWTERQIKAVRNKVLKDNFEERWNPVTRLPPGTKIGYLRQEYDKRPSIKANRAGTRGFRAPEVVLKCPDQTMALDIWSVGVTLLCFLTRRFPFFTSADDTDALLEIACIFGKKRTEKCAALHNRTFLTNLAHVEHPRYASLHELVRDLNPCIFVENMPPYARRDALDRVASNMYTDPPTVRALDHSEWYNESAELWQAVDLLKKCLTMDCTRRITAHDALSHPFLTGLFGEVQQQ